MGEMSQLTNSMTWNFYLDVGTAAGRKEVIIFTDFTTALYLIGGFKI